MKLIKPFILWIIVILTTISCEDDTLTHIIYYKDKWAETYYNGTGHSNKVVLDNGSKYRNIVTLDNFTKDAFDIRERFYDNRPNDSIHYWLSFNYLMFSTSCKEVTKSMAVFPNSISSPNWWPDDLKKSFFSINLSRYKFYRCRAVFAGAGLSFFEYFAIDNTTKTGYYWKTLLHDTDEKSIRKCYYAWEDYK